MIELTMRDRIEAAIEALEMNEPEDAYMILKRAKQVMDQSDRPRPFAGMPPDRLPSNKTKG